MVHREAIADRKKKKLMNLNLKVINYNRDIMERIFRNTSDLSKQPKDMINSERVSLQNEPAPELSEPEVEVLSKSSRGYEIR
jgi:hypothetical protein